MTMFLAPYTAIADIDGSPLDAGFLFFGEYGKDPELFPIKVFWDADLTVPAAQPIRTRNGYPVRNGSPTKVYLKTAQHSIAIKNRNSAFILVDFNNNQQEINDARVVAVDSIADLVALPEHQRREDLRYLVRGYHAGSDVGGGEFNWKAGNFSTEVGGDPLSGIYVAPEGEDGRYGAFVRAIRGTSCDVMWFGAVPGGIVDATGAMVEAAKAARRVGTLCVPNVDLLVLGTVDVYTSCEFHGRFIVPAGNGVTTFQAVTPVELEINGADALLSMSRDDTQLHLKGDFDLPDLSDYYLSIRSTEVLQVRLGDPVRYKPYTKNQTVDIVDNDGTLKNPVLYTIDDLSTVTLHFIRKESPITVRELNIVLTGEGELQNQRLFLVRRYGVEFNGLRVYGRDGGAVGTGIELRDSCNIVIRNSSLNQIGTDTVDFDSYQIVNYRSSFVYIYNHDWQRGDTPIRRSYNARHGDFVYFQDSTLAGIDDHYGSNYFINHCTLNQHVAYAGRNISIKSSQFIGTEHLIRIRPDTPYAEGEAIIEDCTMYMAPGATRIPEIIYYNISGQSDTRPYNRDMRVFDKIKIKNVSCVINTDTPMPWPSSVTPAAILIFANFTNPAIEANNKLFIGDVEMEGVDWGTHLLRVTAGNVETHLGSLSFRNTKLRFLYEGAADPASVRLTGSIASAGNIRFEWCENPHIFAHQVPLEGAEINIVGGVFRAEAHCDYFMRLNAFEGRITYRDANFIRRGGGDFTMSMAHSKFIDNHFDSEWSATTSNYGARVYARGNSGMSNSLPVETSRGVATVSEGSTSTTVNHNLGRTPLLRDISLIPTNRQAGEASYWVSDLNPTSFTLNVAEAPSPGFATFHWKLNQ